MHNGPVVRGVNAFKSAALTTVLTLLSGCELLTSEPPFRYVDVAAIEGSEARCASVAAAEAEIENVSNRTITAFVARLSLYVEPDNETAPARHVSVRWKNTTDIPAGERRSFCVRLDDAFHYLPAAGVRIDLLHIHRVRFANGRTWKDPLAAYVWDASYVRRGADETSR
jgi:hypothetical protein